MVIEELLLGDELSEEAFSDGVNILVLPAAQDHKRIFDGDKGPNTGGMGCYAPAPLATLDLISEIRRTITEPTIEGMRKDGSYGRLYLLMIKATRLLDSCVSI